jgi:hypothetical protein
MKMFEPINLCQDFLLNPQPPSPLPHSLNEVRGAIDWRICGDQDTTSEE